MMAQRPAVVAFDVIETMFSLDTVRQRFIDLGLPAHLLELWFARLLRDGFALVASGDYQPFPQVASSALAPILMQHDIATSATDGILAAFGELDAHPDVEPALRMLAGAGVRVVALSNGGADTTRSLIERAGFTPFIEQVLSVDDVKHWKPHPAVYEYAARSTGVEPDQLALIAVHSWDILGARRAGLVTGWASRLEGYFPPALGQPDVHGESLTEVVDRLLHLSTSNS